jgi:PAS domain S-box-containing protein
MLLYRQHLWASVPLGPIACAAVVQALAGLAMFSATEAGSDARIAVAAACVLSILTLPFGRLAARLSRKHPRAYWWSGRVWAVAIPTLFAKTIPGAFDGTGPALAERVTMPFMFAAVVVLSFSVGAQGALLAVPTDTAINVEMLLIAMSVIKLQAAYTHAYVLLQLAVLGGIALGYACVSKYTDAHEATREAAEAVAHGAEALRDPFVVADEAMTILAVNAQFTEVLGYEAAEVVGQNVTMLMANRFDIENHGRWVHAYLASDVPKLRGTKGLEVEVRTKAEDALPVRLTIGETRCPINATRVFTAVFPSMALEQRNAQLVSEKEKLQWEVASHYEAEQDPRELLGATVPEDLPDCAAAGRTCPHRTLGAMQDQQKTDKAVSCANSFDHVDSSALSNVPEQTLISPSPPCSTISEMRSIVSLESSVMDTVSQAAKKSPTSAPPPPKSSRLQRVTKVRSEPSAAKPTAGTNKNTTPKRVALPTVEHSPRERG